MWGEGLVTFECFLGCAQHHLLQWYYYIHVMGIANVAMIEQPRPVKQDC